MRRTYRLQLHRRQEKKLRGITVVVQQVTLGGFIEALRVAGTKVMQFRDQVRAGGDMTERDVVMALAHPDVCSGVADVLCPDQPRGWFAPWHSQRNVLLMLEAARKTSDWSRLIGELDFTGKKRQGTGQAKGSLYSDAITVARILGVNPVEIIDQWPMERFLDVCEGMLRANEAAKEAEMLEDPTMDPNAEPTPLRGDLGGKVYIT